MCGTRGLGEVAFGPQAGVWGRGLWLGERAGRVEKLGEGGGGGLVLGLWGCGGFGR